MRFSWCIDAYRDQKELWVVKTEERMEVSSWKNIFLDNQLVIELAVLDI